MKCWGLKKMAQKDEMCNIEIEVPCSALWWHNLQLCRLSIGEEENKLFESGLRC
jgi:hypothetical protein